MIGALLLTLASASAPPTHTASLSCGAATFQIVSHAWPRTLAPVTQTASVRVAGRRRTVTLDPTGTVIVDGHRVRNRYVLSWSCVKGAGGTSYVSLGYACAMDPGYPFDCGGEKEWFRLLDDRGRAVDTGVPHNGPTRDRLDRRLGLSDIFEAGVQMTDVLE